MRTLKKILITKKYVKVPLVFTATNHFELIAKINGVNGRFILDTGASNTCLGLDKVDMFRLKSEHSEVKAAGAGAINMDTKIATDNKVKIGKWKIGNLKIVLFDLAHVNEALGNHKALPVDGIIGADILKKARAVIDYGHHCIYLKM